MSTSTAEPKKALGVRATAAQHRLIAEAAKREHRSVSNFVLQAALKASEPRTLPPPRFTAEEENTIAQQAREMFRRSSAYEDDLLEELFAERRADALRGLHRLRHLCDHCAPPLGAIE